MDNHSSHRPVSFGELIDGRRAPNEPNWITGDLSGYREEIADPIMVTSASGQLEAPEPLQQSDLLKPFFMDIATRGLDYAYKKYGPNVDPTGDSEVFEASVVSEEKKKDVIIIGAGIAGLVAAHELKRAGHNVKILEAQERIGGRIKTYDHKDGFKKGLYVDAGAMRIPSPVHKHTVPNKIHFLTDYYAEKYFGLKIVDFINENKHGFLKFYNKPKVHQKDWTEADFRELWPGWDRTIELTGAKSKYSIGDIDSYFEVTVNVIIDQLRISLVSGITQKERAAIWNEWLEVWAQFSFKGFLQSSKDSIIQQVPPRYKIGLDKLGELLPWPDAAVTAYEVFTYTMSLDTSLVAFLREYMGHWWGKHMHHIDGGMSKLPEAFLDSAHGSQLRENITQNFIVTKVEYKSLCADVHNRVVVKGFKRGVNGERVECKAEGNAVIVTTPVNILRQIKFVPLSAKGLEERTPPMPNQFYKSIEDIWYSPSTKIMIQTKSRFWHKDDHIRGGFSKTNLPIGQLHYPSNHPPHIKEGILLCYTWKSEALMFGALPPKLAIAEAIEQISEIHPEIKEHDMVEATAIQAWYNDPAAQGAYAQLKPHQVQNVKWLMYPWKNIYFAGEAISFANGWIQGAMESGLRAAYQFYARNENSAKQ